MSTVRNNKLPLFMHTYLFMSYDPGFYSRLNHFLCLFSFLFEFESYEYHAHLSREWIFSIKTIHLYDSHGIPERFNI